MPGDPKTKRQGSRAGSGDRPRTDLPPRKIPYDDDYFGTGEEEGVVQEREAGEEQPRPPARRSP